MSDKVAAICNKSIEYLFYALFFLVPLIFLPVNYELFEFNKMILTYAIAVLIVGFWAIKMVMQGKITIQRTLLDIPILLFLASQIISTIVSIDVHTSIWGYYSRFNGGLASIITYIFLYYAFVSNFTGRGVAGEGDPRRVPAANARTSGGGEARQDPERGVAIMERLLMIALASGTLIAIYGTLEHFGRSISCLILTETFDASCWVQDVQNRVFATLGQPNWLAAYLSVLIPIAIALGIVNSKLQILNSKQIQSAKFKVQNDNSKFKIFNFKLQLLTFNFVLLTSLFYLTLLFTKSRSGFLGLWIGIAFFFTYIIWQKKQLSKFTIYYLLFTILTIGSITFLIGSPFDQLNKFTLEGIRSRLQPATYNLPFGFAQGEQPNKPQGTALEVGGGTESGEIRKIVWKGAIDIARAYPLFGSGVETFAYSYYKFRPIEHNKTSEWDFLYNKAHNEYLNYLANTGIFGLGSYLLMIATFIVLCIKYYVSSIKQKIHNTYYLILSTSLLAGYISILVSNFFGFSVVIVNLFFFLIPAFVFVLNNQLNPKDAFVLQVPISIIKISNFKFQISNFLIILVILTTYYLLLTTYRMWDADRDFAIGKNFNKTGELTKAFTHLVSAIQKRPGEPVFSEELSSNTSSLALLAYEQKDSTLSAQFVNEAKKQSDYTIRKSPNNTNFWRTRVRVFYTLSQIDEKYYDDTLAAAKKLSQLSPTDPKVGYNYGLILGQQGNLDEAIKELEKTISLKPDYRDPIYALGVFYHEKATDERGRLVNQEFLDKAILQMENVLKLASDDAEAKEKLKEWRGL